MSQEMTMNTEEKATLPPYSTLPSPYVQGQPIVVTMQPQPTHILMPCKPPGTKLPLYALVTSLIITLIFAGFCCYIPGLLCLIPAVSTALCGIVKSESNKIADAKKLAITSFILVIVFFLTYPFIVFTIAFTASFIPYNYL